MSNRVGVGRGPKIAKNGLSMGVKIGSDAGKIGNNTRLLVVMRARLLHKIGLHNLTNWNRFKK